MAIISQHAVVLDSQNKLRNADRMAREWAIAHAGVYRGQAQHALGGSSPLREWSNDELAIRIFKMSADSFRQIQLCSVQYTQSAGSEPYSAYVLTYASPQGEQVGGYCTAVVSAPDQLFDLELPWDDAAGTVGVERLVQVAGSDRTRPVRVEERSGPVTGIDELFAIHDTSIVLTADGQSDDDLRELAELHSDWAGVVSITTEDQIVLGRELQDHLLPGWIRAKIAVFSRYPDSDGQRLRTMETGFEPAVAFLDEERDRIANEAANRNSIALMRVLESVSTTLSISLTTDAKDIADASPEASAEPDAGERQASDPVAAQQRIYVLEDQLSEAEQTISALREQLAQYEAHYSEEQADDPDDVPEYNVPGELDVNRTLTVLNAIGDEKRLPRLRFLANSVKPLEDYGKPRPNGVEILQALDAINLLAEAWHNTPSRNIGSWATHFINLPGWKYAADESESTMGLHGEKRSFSDQEVGRQITITRHLTYKGSSGGLQIYFHQDDAADKFIIGYIGEHLSYATSRS